MPEPEARPGRVPKGGRPASVEIIVGGAAVALVAAVAVLLWRRELRRARVIPMSAPDAEDQGWSFGPRGGDRSAIEEVPHEADAAGLPPDSSDAPPPGPEAEATHAEGVSDAGTEGSRPGGGPAFPADSASDMVLLELLDDERPSVRRNAVIALAVGRGAHALRGLSYAASQDPSVEVRREAILGLGSLMGKRSESVESPQTQGVGPTDDA
ncbi:MAG: HEAT repeat domain-containing protein [Actinomycetota bacterium]